MFRNHIITVFAAVFAMLLVAGCPDPELEPMDTDDVEEGALTIEPSVINFGELAPQELDVQSFTVVNHTAQAVTLGAIEITPASGDFRLPGAPSGVVIEPGYTQTVDVEFQPLKEGAAEAIVTVGTDHPDYTTLLVDVFGFALADEPVGDDDDSEPPEETCGTLELDTTPLDFGTVIVGQHLEQLVSLTNTGSEPLELFAIEVAGDGFDKAAPAPAMLLGAGMSTEFNVRFAPTADGVHTGELTIESCDASTPVVTVELAGLGEETCGNHCQGDIYLNYIAIDFGTVTGGIAWADFTVTNQGIDPLTLQGISTPTSIAGGQITILSGDEHAVLQPGESEYFTFEWVAGDLFGNGGCLDGMDGAYHAITVYSDDPDEPAVDLMLYGCADCAGTGLCAMVNFIDLILCIDASECSDAVTGLLHCTLGFPC